MRTRLALLASVLLAVPAVAADPLRDSPEIAMLAAAVFARPPSLARA